MDDYIDFESGLLISGSKHPGGYTGDISGVYVPEPNATSVDIPDTTNASGGWWKSLTNAVSAIGGVAQTGANVYRTARGNAPASNVAKQTGALTQQQLDAQRAAERSNASAGSVLSKYGLLILGLVALGVLAFVISGQKRKA